MTIKIKIGDWVGCLGEDSIPKICASKIIAVSYCGKYAWIGNEAKSEVLNSGLMICVFGDMKKGNKVMIAAYREWYAKNKLVESAINNRDEAVKKIIKGTL